MSRPTDVRIMETRLETESLTFRAPLKFGGRVVEHYQIINVTARVSTRTGEEATGFGSMPIGHIWSWPTTTLEPSQTEQAMKKLSERIALWAGLQSDFAHAIDHGIALSESLEHLARSVVDELKLAEPMPRLAALVAASPVDAAIHDAFGKANKANTYNLLGEDALSHDLSHYLTPEFGGEYLDRYTLRAPKPRMPIYHLVGALDPLTEGDVTTPIDDGLPVTLADWIRADGLTHLKIKLAGDQPDWDRNRILQIDKVAAEVQAERGIDRWFYSLDFNERCSSADYVLDLLEFVRERSPEGFARIQYIEQPTHRDLVNHGIAMHQAAKVKPVVIDESLVDLESLERARSLGYSGVALKACKGQTESLLMAAAAQKFGMFLCVQDLTCPGASFLQSAGLAARIPGVAAIEGNGRQYCPAGNKGWRDRFPGMFQIKDGTIATGCLDSHGLGHG